jgi:hypothetical protein
MFQLIIQNLESRLRSLHIISHSVLLITNPPNPPLSTTYANFHNSNPFSLLNTHLHHSHHPLYNVSSPAIPCPHPSMLDPRLCCSTTDPDLISTHANIHLRPRNSPPRTHIRRQDPAPPMRQPAMFLRSRPSGNLTSISGNQYHPLHYLCSMLHHHLRH